MTDDCDIAIVGGGFAGATLALLMARAGCKVLVLEKVPAFTDRVRGEALLPWGVAEARALGLEDLIGSQANRIQFFEISFGPADTTRRDLPATTPEATGVLSFHHPHMQEFLLQQAAQAGADVIRGAKVLGVEGGESPRVQYFDERVARTASPRLIVGADGRDSLMRSRGGFALQRDPSQLLTSGVLLENVPIAADTALFQFNLLMGQMSLLIPHGTGKLRTYLFHQSCRNRRFSGKHDLEAFLAAMLQTGLDQRNFQSALAAGPLATFDGAARWVEHPYRSGMALIGDAAGTSDPTWGSGLSESLRDVRLLRDMLVQHENWEQAGNAYAVARNEGYQRIRTVNNWYAQVFMSPDNNGLERMKQMIPAIAGEPDRMPDFFALGPQTPVDEQTRRRFFCEDL